LELLGVVTLNQSISFAEKMAAEIVFPKLIVFAWLELLLF